MSRSLSDGDPLTTVRFSLLDLKAAVLVFGVGYWWMKSLSNSAPPLFQFLAGGVLGAILLPPIVMATQWSTGRRTAIIALGEKLSLVPLAGVVFLFFGIAAQIDASGWMLLWMALQWSVGLVAAIALIRRLGTLETRPPLGGLEIYGYLICVMMAGVATLEMATRGG